MKKIFYFLLIVFLFIQCKTQIKTISIKKSKNFNGIIYSLPLTTIDIVFNLQKKSIQTAPYGDFTSKYIGIENPIHKNVALHSLENIEIKTQSIPDSANIYISSIHCGNKNIQKKLSILSEKNWIYTKPIDSPKTLSFIHLNNNINSTIPIPINGNVKEKTDTIYKNILKDSVYIKVPILKKQSYVKTTEEKAKETAEFIIALRKNRLESIAEMDETKTNINVFNTKINLLEQIEKDYLELFTGITNTTSLQTIQPITPTQFEVNKKYLLCRFSEKLGIVDTSNTGIPIYYELTTFNHYQSLTNLSNKSTEKGKCKNGFFYRIPENASIRIFMEDQLIIEQTITVSQFGKILTIDEKYIQ